MHIVSIKFRESIKKMQMNQLTFSFLTVCDEVQTVYIRNDEIDFDLFNLTLKYVQFYVVIIIVICFSMERTTNKSNRQQFYGLFYNTCVHSNVHSKCWFYTNSTQLIQRKKNWNKLKLVEAKKKKSETWITDIFSTFIAYCIVSTISFSFHFSI